MGELDQRTFLLSKDDPVQRLDHALVRLASDLSRARIQAFCHAGHVRVNGKQAKPSEHVRPGDLVQLAMPPTQQADLLPEELPLDILFEDEYFIVLNKAPGMVVHPGAGHHKGTVVHALLHHCGGLSSIGGVERPGIVHRLDKETSGCLVVAKNDVTHLALARQFAERQATKIYLALAKGALREPKLHVATRIGRHPVHRKKMAVVEAPRGKEAETTLEQMGRAQDWSVVRCTLHTGRTHQIRVHLHHLGHPILGDRLYSGPSVQGVERVMLHAQFLGFQHPVTHAPYQFEAPLPDDFQALLAQAGFDFSLFASRKFLLKD